MILLIERVHVALLLHTLHCLCSRGWDYDNSNSWSGIYSLCDHQVASPLHINTSSCICDPDVCAPLFEWDIDFKTQTFKIDKDAHTIVIKGVQELMIDPFGRSNALDQLVIAKDGTQYATLTSNTNTIASFPNYFKPESSDHHRFCMDSIHFHWGSNDKYGSSHSIDAHTFPLEAHFVHYSCNHPNLRTTLSQFQTEKNVTDAIETGMDTHQLGVVSIQFNVVANHINPSFDIVLQHLAGIQDTNEYDSEIAHIATGLDLRQMIPKNIQSAGYYAYEGALPTAPCVPNIVRWHVMNARGYIGSTQMVQLRKLMSDVDDEMIVNYRTIQRNVTEIYSCIQDSDRDARERLKRKRTERSIVWVIAIITMLTPVVLGTVCIYQNTEHIWMKETKQVRPKPPPRTRSMRMNSILEQERTTHAPLDNALKLVIDQSLAGSTINLNLSGSD